MGYIIENRKPEKMNILYKTIFSKLKPTEFFNQKLLLAFLVSLLGLTACQRVEEPPFFISKQCASIPVGRASAAIFVIDSTAYVLAGRSESGNTGRLNDFWMYDAHVDSWVDLGTLPFAARVKPIAEVVNGKAYTGLGFDGVLYDDTGYFRDFWMYDPQTEEWARKADFPVARTAAASSFVHKQFIYVLYGTFETTLTNDIYRYDTELDKWEFMGAAKLPLRSAAVAVAYGDRFFSGTGYRLRSLSDWYEFFPESNRWEKRKPIPGKGRLFSSAVAGKKVIYVFGGRNFAGTETGELFHETIYSYVVDSNHWNVVGNIPGGGRENMISFSIGNSIYFGLGENKDGEILNDLYRWEEY